jgi:hypothetical protein
MRRTWIALLAVAAGLCGWLGRAALGEDAPGGAPGGADAEKWMEDLATPGEMHRWLGAQAGDYDLDLTSYTPKGREESKATASVRMILGGRFQEQRIRGTMAGKPFEGFGITGYDNAKKEFVYYWFDSMGTSASVARGQRSADGTSVKLDGSWDMPGGAMTFTMTTTVRDERHMGFRMTGTWQGKETPMLEATYTRQ